MAFRDVPWWVWASGVAVTLAMAMRRDITLDDVYTYGRPDSPTGISRDPHKLLPAFAKRLELLFRAMRARGFDPILHEGWRSRERAHTLALQGVGIDDSLHYYGAAVDIISKSKMWSDPAFFQALAEEATKLKLYPGLYFPTDPDPPHIQAVPWSENVQDALRASREPNEFIKKYLG